KSRPRSRDLKSEPRREDRTNVSKIANSNSNARGFVSGEEFVRTYCIKVTPALLPSIYWLSVFCEGSGRCLHPAAGFEAGVDFWRELSVHCRSRRTHKTPSREAGGRVLGRGS